MRSGQDDGEFRPDPDPEGVAGEVMAFITGSTIEWLLDPDAIDVTNTYRDYSPA